VADLGQRVRGLIGREPEDPRDRIDPELLNSAAVVFPEWAGMVPPRELWIGPEDPVSHFFGWAYEYRAYLTLLCGLRRDGRVLELGCGHGRTMLGLVPYLRPGGRYEGFDISAPHIEFAKRAIEARHPNLRFSHADVHNSIYNPDGAIAADEFVLPYAEAGFDVAFAASLFTHLLPPAVVNYLSQTARLLVPGGRALYSFFLLDNYRGPGSSIWDFYEFEHPHSDGVAIHDPERPDQLVAYSVAAIERIATAAGLEVERTIPGYWSNPDGVAVNEQDLVLLRRPA
jgi:SAM-dependent methyltransferase